MILGDILLEVGEICVHDAKLEINIRSYVNRAIRYIAQRRNWSGMFDWSQVTLLAGNFSVTMPDTFKELGREASPISFNYGQYRLPVNVLTRSQIESFGVWPFVNGPLSMPIPGSYVPIQVVFMERRGPGGPWTLNIPPQFSATQNQTYNVQGYYYPSDLAQASDSNFFTTQPEIVEAVIAKAKSIAFFAQDPTSDKGEAARKQFEDLYVTALYSDASQAMSQVPLRM